VVGGGQSKSRSGNSNSRLISFIRQRHHAHAKTRFESHQRCQDGSRSAALCRSNPYPNHSARESGKPRAIVKLSIPKTNADLRAKIQASIPQNAPLLSQSSPDRGDSNAITLPPPLPTIQLTPLLGSAPTDHLRTLYALYASQVATIVWIAEAGGLADERRRSVVVGLALKKSGEENQGLSEAERGTFHQVMGMVEDLVKE
jgi:proteasome assembly chaperone 3